MLSLRHGLGQRDRAWERLRSGFLPNAQPDSLSLDGSDVCPGLGALAIEDRHMVARAKAEHVKNVMRFALIERGQNGVPLTGRKVKTVH